MCGRKPVAAMRTFICSTWECFSPSMLCAREADPVRQLKFFRLNCHSTPTPDSPTQPQISDGLNFALGLAIKMVGRPLDHEPENNINSEPPRNSPDRQTRWLHQYWQSRGTKSLTAAEPKSNPACAKYCPETRANQNTSKYNECNVSAASSSYLIDNGTPRMPS